MTKTDRYAYIILGLGVAIVMGALGFARFGYTMILPRMQEGLSLKTSQTGDLAAANMVGYLALSVACGFLASRFGPKIVICISLVFISLSMLFTGLSRSFPSALVFRFLAGAGSGGANVPVMGLVSAWFVSKRRGFASGIVVSGSSFGLLITGFALPAVFDAYGVNGWRYAWGYLAGGTLIIAFLCVVLLRNNPPVVEEQKVNIPAARLADVVKSRYVWLLSAIYSLFGFSYIIYATFFARALISEGGFTEKSAGSLWSIIGAASVASGLIWGLVSDKIGRKYALGMVFFLQGVSFSLFGLWGAAPGYYISALLFALTAWSIPAVMAAAAGDLLGPRLAPAAFGVITLFFGIGQVAGPFAGGRIAAAAGSFGPAFIAAGVAAIAGSIFSFTTIPRVLKVEKPPESTTACKAGGLGAAPP